MKECGREKRSTTISSHTQVLRFVIINEVIVVINVYILVLVNGYNSYCVLFCCLVYLIEKVFHHSNFSINFL